MDEAESLLRAIVEESPSWGIGGLNLGRFLVQSARAPEAIPHLRKAVK